MPKKRQIPFLQTRKLSDGSTTYDWKPSNKLRDLGWPHVTLGTEEADAVRQALEINTRLATWRQSSDSTLQPRNNEGPRLVRWDGLIKRYRNALDYSGLKPATRKEYDSRIRWLTSWALDGQLIIRQIDHGMVRDLKRALEKSDSSDHRTAAMLRVLRLLMSFAEREGIIPHGSNPANRTRIREPRSRRHIMSLEAVEAVCAHAEGQNMPNLSLAVLLGFWTIQRQGDLLANFNRFAWRELHDVETRDAALLAGTNKRVMGFRLQQEKTGAWVDAPVPPFLHEAIEQAFRLTPLKNNGLLRDDTPGHTHKPLESWRLQRRWRAATKACADQARKDGRLLLAAELENGQFRDLRRSGMVYMRDAGSKKEWITSLSGHTLLSKKSILDTYMPADTAAACAAVAQALRMKNRQLKEQAG